MGVLVLQLLVFFVNVIVQLRDPFLSALNLVQLANQLDGFIIQLIDLRLLLLFLFLKLSKALVFLVKLLFKYIDFFLQRQILVQCILLLLFDLLLFLVRLAHFLNQIEFILVKLFQLLLQFSDY